MEESFSKTRLLKEMRSGYDAFEQLLSTLNEDDMTTPNVNGNWSVKDNLAHLGFWHEHVLNMLNGAQSNTEPEEDFPGLDADEANEHIYAQNKDRALADTLSTFRSTYQQVLAKVEEMSEEALTTPRSWLGDNSPVWPYVIGNVHGHYEEHSQIINDWLARGKK